MSWKDEVEIEVTEGQAVTRSVIHFVTVTFPDGEEINLDLEETIWEDDNWRFNAEYNFINDNDADKIAEKLGITYEELIDYCVELLEGK